MIKSWVLPIIVSAQFFCASIWFASNGVMDALISSFELNTTALGHLTSAVQLGFITGTLIFALLAIADRYSPSLVFFLSALAGALFNIGAIWNGNTFASLTVFRFFTGFFLAGIYPVGMKISADYYQKGLGRSLGYLVGALVLGTAFPHLLKDFSGKLPWELVVVSTSVMAVLGGFIMWYFVPDGPFRKPVQKLFLGSFVDVFRSKKFRAAAFGYFGHMWELYAFWAFLPLLLLTYSQHQDGVSLNIPFWSFVIIGSGGVACVLGGYLSLIFGAKKTASISLMLSGACCIISPFMFQQEPSWVFLSFLIFWGLVVIADSPLFSTLVAQNAKPEFRGTALTIVNCIGFAITIISIQMISLLVDKINPGMLFATLAIGPLLGLLGLWSGESEDG